MQGQYRGLRECVIDTAMSRQSLEYEESQHFLQDWFTNADRHRKGNSSHGIARAVYVGKVRAARER